MPSFNYRDVQGCRHFLSSSTPKQFTSLGPLLSAIYLHFKTIDLSFQWTAERHICIIHSCLVWQRMARITSTCRAQLHWERSGVASQADCVQIWGSVS